MQAQLIFRVPAPGHPHGVGHDFCHRQSVDAFHTLTDIVVLAFAIALHAHDIHHAGNLGRDTTKLLFASSHGLQRLHTLGHVGLDPDAERALLIALDQGGTALNPAHMAVRPQDAELTMNG